MISTSIRLDSTPVQTPTRINIVLSDKARTDLQEIATKTRRSMSDVIRMALALLKVAFDELALGHKIAIIDSNGKPLKEIVLAG